MPAVADEDPLPVPHVRVLAGEVQVRGGVLDAHRCRLGEPPRGVDRPVEHVRDGAAHRLPQQRAVQDSGHHRGERGKPEHAPVRKHRDSPRVGRRHRRGEPYLLVRQLDRGPVEALGLLRGGQAQEQHRGVGGPCRRDSLGDHRLIGARAVHREARRVGHLPRHHGQRLQRRVQLGRRHVRAAAALVARFGGEHADHGERVASRQRQHRPAVGDLIVLEQHDAPCRRLTGQRVMRVSVVPAPVP